MLGVITVTFTEATLASYNMKARYYYRNGARMCCKSFGDWVYLELTENSWQNVGKQTPVCISERLKLSSGCLVSTSSHKRIFFDSFRNFFSRKDMRRCSESSRTSLIARRVGCLGRGIGGGGGGGNEDIGGKGLCLMADQRPEDFVRVS